MLLTARSYGSLERIAMMMINSHKMPGTRVPEAPRHLLDLMILFHSWSCHTSVHLSC